MGYHLNHSLVGSLIDDLLLEGVWLGETKGDLVGGELVVDVGDGSESVDHDFSVKWVEEDSLVLSAVNGHSGGSSIDVGWEALFTLKKDKGLISKFYFATIDLFIIN